MINLIQKILKKLYKIIIKECLNIFRRRKEIKKEEGFRSMNLLKKIKRLYTKYMVMLFLVNVGLLVDNK